MEPTEATLPLFDEIHRCNRGADYFPDGMDHETYYQPIRNGYESQISERLRHWTALRARRRGG